MNARAFPSIHLTKAKGSSGGGGMTSFILAGDAGTPQTIADGNTLTIEGGTGIDTAAAATDKVTVSIDSTVATLTGAQTLSNKTLTTPTIGDFSNAEHNHQNATGGGTLNAAAIASGVLANARVNFAAPDAIGGTTPNSGAFTTLTATGQIGGPNGSAGTPALSFTGDTDTGIYRVTADTLGFSVAGSARMVFSGSGLRVSRGGASPTSAPASALDVQRHDSATGTITELLRLIRTVSGAGVGANGVGGSIALAAETSTSGDLGEIAAQIDYLWNNATHASRLGEMALSVADVATLREGLRLRAASGAAQIGFLGATPVSRPTVSGSRGGNAALASLLTALANLGLITDSTTA